MGAGDTSLSPTCSACGHMEKQLRLKVLNRAHQLLVTSFPSCAAWAGNLTSLGPTVLGNRADQTFVRKS